MGDPNNGIRLETGMEKEGVVADGWVLVPLEPTEAMREAGSRSINAAQGSKDDDHPLHHPAQNSWEEPSMKWWEQWNETADDAYRAMLAAAPQPTATGEDMAEELILPNGNRLVEPAVPVSVLKAFENKHSRGFDLSVFDGDWGNTHRYKHDHIQSAWEGWRDGYLALRVSPAPSQHTGWSDEADTDRMQKISEVIAHLQSIQDRFGDTCVYIRRGGLSWGAVALNRRDDDKKNGVFDLQAQHDLDMSARLQQVQRLIDGNRELRTQAALAASPIAPATGLEVLMDKATALEGSLEVEGSGVNAYLRDDIEALISAIRSSISPSVAKESGEPCPRPDENSDTYYKAGKDATWFEALSDKDFAWEITKAQMDLSDSGLGNALDLWMPFQAMISDAADRINRLLVPASDRQSNRAEVERAALFLAQCNGHDLDVWTKGNWPDDAFSDAIKALTKGSRKP